MTAFFQSIKRCVFNHFIYTVHLSFSMYLYYNLGYVFYFVSFETEISMSFFKDFKDFAMRGNVVDLAVGVIIGAAFGKIVTSLVNDVVMPPIGLLLGGVDFSNLFIPLTSGAAPTTFAEAKAAGIPMIAYGLFLNTVFEFLIIALCIFTVISQIKRFTPVEAPVEVRKCDYCREAIADDATRCPHCTAELAIK